MMVAFHIVDNEQLLALLLHFGGEDLYDIFEGLLDENKTPNADEDENVFDKGIEALTNHFVPQQNSEFQKYQLRHAEQSSGESFDQYVSRLRDLATTCGFANPENEIKSQIISGCSSHKLRIEGFRHPAWTLVELIESGKSYELADQNARSIENTTVNALKAHNSQSAPHYGQDSSSSREQRSTCMFCNGAFPHRGPCPARDRQCRSCGATGHFSNTQKCAAKGQICQKCGKLNHIAALCQSESRNKSYKPTYNARNKVRNVDETESTNNDPDYLWHVSDSFLKHPVFSIHVNGISVRVLADSGSNVNLLSYSDYLKLPQQSRLIPHDKNIFAYGSRKPLAVKGKFEATLVAKGKSCKTTLIVSTESDKSLLSWQTSQDLGLLNAVAHLESSFIESLKTEYQDIFTGLGKLKDVKIKLHIDDSVKPVFQNRRLPFHVRKDVEKQIQLDEDQDVIEVPVGPTPWVSPITYVPKKQGGGRVCVDMRAANVAIQREHHPTPTLTELTHLLNGATVFSKVDLNQGYNQLELDESSRYITTFTSHVGLRRYKRLTFGINSAAEIFQEEIRRALSGLSGVVNVSDDILCYSTNLEQHNANLRALFQRLREKGLTLNAAKCSFHRQSVEFYGHIFSADGVKASPNKTSALLDMPAPQNSGEVRSLLGMLNYCGQRFVKDYATLTHKIRELTKKDVPWSWTAEHEDALNKLKKALLCSPTLRYFDPQLETEVYCDASPVGISAILMQKTNDDKRHPIQFASRALTPTEQRYSHIEKEALAITWGCEYLHIYLFGCDNFRVYTDHRPLLGIFGNPLSKPSARMAGWSLRLSQFKFQLLYKPGNVNPADYMSRHVPMQSRQSSREQELAEQMVQYISITSCPKPISLEEVKMATKEDKTLQTVMLALLDNQWNSHRKTNGIDLDTFDRLQLVQGELSVALGNDLLLRGTRLVIPAKLQSKMVDLAHIGHQGMVKTKSLLREKVWFPGIDRLVEHCVKSCMTCQIATDTPAREPLVMSDLPVAPWTELSMDIGQLSNGQYIFVVLDEYTRFPFVELVSSTSASSILPKLDAILSLRGRTTVIKSDNGPPFNGQDMQKYAEQMGFKHRKITPLWPRANAETERFMKSVKKSLNAAIAQGLNWRTELGRFLLAYRATPHATTGIAPATLFFGTPVATFLPEIPPVPDIQNDAVRQRDTFQKHKMKQYADKFYFKTNSFEVGDHVLQRNIGMKKSTPFDPNPLTVVAKQGSMITAANDAKTVTRNSSFFKKSPMAPFPGDTEPNDDLVDPGVADRDNAVVKPTEKERVQDRPVRERKLPAKFQDFDMT